MNEPSSNNYFEDLFANTSDLIHFANLEGRIEVVNPAWLNTLGYRSEEVLGKSIYDYVWDDEVETYKKYRAACINNVALEDIQVTFKRKNGQPAIVEGHLRPYFQGGQLLHTRGVFRDITLRLQKQKEADDELSKITNFLKNAPDAVVVINEQQLVVEWNLKAEAVFGFSKEDALHQPLSELIIPIPYREMHKKGMQHFLNTGEGPVLNRTIEVSAINRDGFEFPISLNISNIKLQDEWFFIAFMEDISERRKQQEELLRQKDELLEVKQEDERNKQFLNIASHEIKTPLTSIKAFTQLALRGLRKLPLDQTEEYLKKIDESSDKLKKLVANLLDISKINAGKFSIDKELVEYLVFLEGVVQTCSVIFPSHKVQIANAEPLNVNLDRIRMEQVLMNLVGNAVKYSPQADSIEISVKSIKDTVVTSVKDFGIGIENGDREKVFDKFYQIDELTKTDNSGLGLGLFICSEIIRQHQGTIWVESAKGEGSTFYFSLPL